jgi:succinoglycan biosynthesis protein ExoM
MNRPSAEHISTQLDSKSSVILPHIAVCICTYKRPDLLTRLLTALTMQNTGGRFTYSIVVADNDPGRSAEPVVRRFAELLHTTRAEHRPDTQQSY